MDRLIRDFRYGVRSFARSPGLTAVLLITLAVGTGANATVFSFVDALLFRPADGVANPSRLVEVFTSDYSSTPYGESSYPDYLSMRSVLTSFEWLAAVQNDDIIAIKIGDEAERARVSRVSGDFFAAVGVQSTIGRLLGPNDLVAGAPRSAVIGHELWQRGFGSDERILGTQVTVNGEQYGVVGVAAPRFTGLDLGRPLDVWIPLDPPPDTPEERDKRGFKVIGRLKNGATLDGAQAELTVLAAKLAEMYPDSNLGTQQKPNAPRPMTAVRHARLDPMTRREIGLVSGIMLAATALVLVIACANVASLLLSRATTRSGEMAVRLALGANRGHLVRQLLTESLILAAGGGALGVLFSLWTVGALPSFFPPEIARMLDARVDARVFLFTFAMAFGSGLVFGLVPALQTKRPNVIAGLRGDSGGGQGSRAGARLRNSMVVAQVALSCVLVVSSTLLVRSLANALRADLGYSARNVAIAYIDIPPGDLDEAGGQQYFQQLVTEVRRLPGVEAAGLVSALPLAPGGRRGFQFDGYQPQPTEGMEININVVGETYFGAMRVPLLAGRPFDARDTVTSKRVIVVNDVLAARYFGSSAVGRQARSSNGDDLEIVGVVRTGRYRSLQDDPLPIVYYPLSQFYRSRMVLVARTADDPGGHVETIAKTMRGVRTNVPIDRAMTLDAYMGEALAAERLATALVSTCSAMALVLALVGVYGVMAYAVVRRSREIGVRLALGARPRQIIRLVFSEGLRLTATGVAIGLTIGAALPSVLSVFLFDVGVADILSLVAAPAALALVAAIAAVAPVRRALGVNPMIVLRQQ
ncbi:MAG TPA: ABC transporter permease [Vicinamibacterales bacterium]|nr:ABC transporter permease [Vicinamibacterales bacterium]